QSDQDRFIARDLAIFTLAHIPWLDSTQPRTQAPVPTIPPVTEGPATCGRFYAEAARNPLSVLGTSPPNDATGLFGADPTNASSSPYPPVSAPLDTAPHVAQAAQDRLAFEAHVLRAGGRLLHDLIRRSVYSDLAGAELRN